MLLLAVALLAVTPLAVAADEPSPAPELGIAPADRPGSWFDLELAPGDTEHLSVELANHGDQPLDVASYPADVYTLVGGGMGVRLREEPTFGTARWLDYSDRVEHLAPDQALRRTVMVTVPDDTAPGQYLAALVIENDQPLPAAGELSVERIVRQALAVNITVPGTATPALAIGDADHTLTGGRSVTRLQIDNPGNRHLKPAGILTLTDDTGTVLASRDVSMDSIYAGTNTHLELSLDEPLSPGTYTLSAELSDAEFGVDAAGSGNFEIAAPPLAERLIPRLDGFADTIEATGLPLWAILAAAALLPVVIVVLVLAALRRRRPRRHAVPRPAPAEPSSLAPAVKDPAVNDPPTPPAFDPIAHMEATATRARHTPRTTTPAPHVPPPPPTSPEPRHGTVQRPDPGPAVPPPAPRPAAPPPQPVAAASTPRTHEQASDQPGSPGLFTARTPPRRRRRSR